MSPRKLDAETNKAIMEAVGKNISDIMPKINFFLSLVAMEHGPGMGVQISAQTGMELSAQVAKQVYDKLLEIYGPEAAGEFAENLLKGLMGVFAETLNISVVRREL